MDDLTRTDLQQLAKVRIAEAAVLLANSMWDGAYYLAGYAVECALKACIAMLTAAEDFPDKKFADKCWSHDTSVLVGLAGLSTLRDADAPKGTPRYLNWETVKDWNEQQRY